MARKMRDSGVEWIGEVPEGWEVNLIGTFYSQRSEKVSDRDYAPLSVTMKGVLPQLATVAKTDDGDNRKLVKKGDFAINSRSDRRGSCGISEYDGSVSLINTILMPRGEMDPRYYNWLFHTEAFADEFYKWGHGIVDDLWTTRWSEMKRIQIVAPPLPEQRRIADYLDEKCAAIDGAVCELKRGIEDSKAWKKAIIFEAVTGKANVLAAKNAKVAKRQMRDSGIPWIGEIPEGWEVSRVKRHHKITLGKMLCASLTEDATIKAKYICAANVHFDGVSLAGLKEMWFSESELLEYSVEAGDLLVVEGGAGAGGAAICPTVTDTIGIQNSIMMVRGRHLKDNRYLRYLLESFVRSGYVDFICNKATIPHFTKEKLGNMPVPLPPLHEQQAIANYLDEKCAAIDTLVAEKEKLIADLEAYKKSLIFELVTGKREVA